MTTRAPTWRELWSESAARLAEPQESRWLIEHLSGRTASELLRDLDQVAPETASMRLGELVERRLSGEPLQHVLGHWGFRTLEVAVDSRALVPRPETEVVVGQALFELDRLREARRGGELWALELGTGSGVVAFSLAAEREALRVVATDVSPAALELAASNLAVLSDEAAARVSFFEGDWYGALPGDLAGRFDLIVSNPPYLAEAEWAGLEPTVRDFDPYGALVAGPGGLEAIAAILDGAGSFLAPHGSIVIEIAPHQARGVLGLAGRAGFVDARIEDDLAGRARMVVARR
jgi:release factor glutamine methyltransferase